MDYNENAPPLTPPPLVVPPAGPQRPRRGRGWMIFAIVLLVLLLLSLFFNFIGLVGGLASLQSGDYGPRLDEVVYQDNKASSKIALVDVDGIITSSSLGGSGGYNLVDLVKAELKRAGEDSDVKAVILRVDSPGGEVLASDDINRAITKFQNDTKKPVIASMGNLAASGGYYISVACRWIEANNLTLTGSIGVIMDTFNYRGLMDKVGVSPVVYKSGKFKDMLSGSRETNEIPPEEHELVQKLIDETYDQFKATVQKGRDAAHDQNGKSNDAKLHGTSLSEDWKNYADGRVLSGTEALRLGFVDGLGDLSDAVTKAQAIAGISSANLILYQEHHDLSDLLRIFGESQARPVKLDLGIELPKLKAGQPYFLSPVLMH